MSQQIEEINLKNNGSDYVAMIARAGLGLIPNCGSVLGEIVSAIIPNQRIDRVALYLEMLQSVFNDETLEKIKNLPDKVAMIEEGMFAAGFTTHKERLERIAYVVANGLKADDIKADEVSKLLSAVKSISDYDLIVLKSYKLFGKDLTGHEKALSFQLKHPQIWPSIKHGMLDGDKDKYEQEKKIYEEANEKFISCSRYLTSLSLLKPYKTKTYYDRNDSVENMIEALNVAMSEEEYCITYFGLNVLDVIENPK